MGNHADDKTGPHNSLTHIKTHSLIELEGGKMFLPSGGKLESPLQSHLLLLNDGEEDVSAYQEKLKNQYSINQLSGKIPNYRAQSQSNTRSPLK
jgi:hypothetical protein